MHLFLIYLRRACVHVIAQLKSYFHMISITYEILTSHQSIAVHTHRSIKHTKMNKILRCRNDLKNLTLQHWTYSQNIGGFSMFINRTWQKVPLWSILCCLDFAVHTLVIVLATTIMYCILDFSFCIKDYTFTGCFFLLNFFGSLSITSFPTNLNGGGGASGGKQAL